MEIEELIKQLPDHWEMWTAEECKNIWSDSCREYDKPIFLRKDGLARIYFCSQPSTDCVFSIAFDYHYDGECRGTLEEAIRYSDWYVEAFPLQFNTCVNCTKKAVWYYEPVSEGSLNNKYYCDDCVPTRGCNCNIDSDGHEELQEVNGILKSFPCCEYRYDIYGFPVNEN